MAQLQHVAVALQVGYKDTDTDSRQPLLQPQQQPNAQQQSTRPSYRSGPARNNQDPYGTTQLDTLASYGQLVTPDQQHNPASQAAQRHQEIQPQPASDEAGPSSSAAHSTSQGPRPQITVSDPQKHAEKNLIGVSGGYVTYAVKSFMRMPKYSSRGALVRRRFRDFVVSIILVRYQK